ncbi:hypothetical protein V1509DRAFT_627546 [Lipomyces kononenkoae]
MDKTRFDIISVHSFLRPSNKSYIFGEGSEFRNERWRAMIDHLCEKRKRTQHQSEPTLLSWEDTRDVMAEEEARFNDISEPDQQLQNHRRIPYDDPHTHGHVESTNAEDDECDEFEEEDTPAAIEEQLNCVPAEGEDQSGLAEGGPVMECNINIGLLPVNETHNLIQPAAPTAITFSSSSRPRPPIQTPLSVPAVPPRPILAAPFDANPYTTTITISEWQEFLSRPSTVQIWRRKAILGGTSGTSGGDSEILSLKTGSNSRKKYEWTQVYVCAHAGAPRDRRDPNKRRRKTNKTSIKCGCKARITAGKVIDSDTVVVRWSWEHNGHEYAYPSAQNVEHPAPSGTTGRANNMLQVDREVQSLIEDIVNLQGTRDEAIGDDFQKLLQWRDILAHTLNKGSELFRS